MNKNLGFTFIELIIVFSIIMLVSIVSIGQFNSFLDTNYIEVHSQEIFEVIGDLDSSVKNGEIYDYTLSFSSGAWYMYSVNNTGPYTISLNPTSDYSGTVESDSTDSGVTLSLKTYDGIKIDKNVLYISTGSYDIGFGKNRDYSLKTSFSGTLGNSLFLKFYSEDNLLSQKIDEKKLILEAINSQENKGGSSFTGIILKNINNKKTLTESGGTTPYNKVYLFFSRSGIEKVLEITNQ